MDLSESAGKGKLMERVTVAILKEEGLTQGFATARVVGEAEPIMIRASSSHLMHRRMPRKDIKSNN